MDASPGRRSRTLGERLVHVLPGRLVVSGRRSASSAAPSRSRLCAGLGRTSAARASSSRRTASRATVQRWQGLDCGFPQCKGARSLRSTEVHQPRRVDREQPERSDPTSEGHNYGDLPCWWRCSRACGSPGRDGGDDRPRPGGSGGAERDRGLPARALHVGGAAAATTARLGHSTAIRGTGRDRPTARTSGHGGKSTIDWQVSFVPAAGRRPRRPTRPAEDMAGRGAAERADTASCRRTSGRVDPAVALLTKGPGDNNAQYESVVAFALCSGLFVTTKFSVLNPVVRVRGRPELIRTSSTESAPGSGTTTTRCRRSPGRRSRAICPPAA